MADGNHKEIERKFLLKYLPKNYEDFPIHNIEQTYINLYNPEHRIRKQNDAYYETFKGEGNLSRSEEEKQINYLEYQELLNKKISRIIYKRRYYVPLNNDLVAELNVYEEDLKGLYLIEVEFPSVEDANAFIKPGWFGMEVTNDNEFKNQYLATCKLEEIEDLINKYYKTELV